jgi:hypothetical protein
VELHVQTNATAQEFGTCVVMYTTYRHDRQYTPSQQERKHCTVHFCTQCTLTRLIFYLVRARYTFTLRVNTCTCISYTHAFSINATILILSCSIFKMYNICILYIYIYISLLIYIYIYQSNYIDTFHTLLCGSSLAQENTIGRHQLAIYPTSTRQKYNLPAEPYW